MCVKLLIADDEDMIRNGIAKYIKLHTDRYETIYLAKNGQEALDIIYRHKPDIMLLDVQMPHKDGIEVMQEAYRAGVLPCTIILSGYDEFRYAQQAIRLGARDYLLKPSRSSDILKKLNAIADEKFKEPEEPVLLPEGRNRIVERAKDYLEEHYYEDLSLTEVAEHVGITASYLSNLFSKQVGMKFVDYLNEVRIDHACTYLRQNYLKNYEIAYKVGFRDEKYFSKVFRRVMDMTPSEYKAGKNVAG
jgi:two-component system response regulator YesN